MTFPNYYQTITPPCSGVHHVYLWTATYTNTEPPDGTPCVCGAVKIDTIRREYIENEGKTI